MKPEPTASDLLDTLELSHNRFLMLFQVDPDSLDDPPPLLLQGFDSSLDVEDCDSGGSVWFHPEDLPKVIEWLQQSLEKFRRCRELDASRLPAPYWGDLGETPPLEGDARPERKPA